MIGELTRTRVLWPWRMKEEGALHQVVTKYMQMADDARCEQDERLPNESMTRAPSSRFDTTVFPCTEKNTPARNDWTSGGLKRWCARASCKTFDVHNCETFKKFRIIYFQENNSKDIRERRWWYYTKRRLAFCATDFSPMRMNIIDAYTFTNIRRSSQSHATLWCRILNRRLHFRSQKPKECAGKRASERASEFPSKIL